MASSYHNLGILAQDRGDYDEAARQYQRALDIRERLGDQAGMASSYHSSASSPRTAGTTTRPPASTSAPWTSASGSATRPARPAAYRNLGILAQDRGDYDEAARQYQRALDICERIGDQAGMASQLQPARHPGKGPRRPGCRSHHLACESARDQAPPRLPPGGNRPAPPGRLPLGTGPGPLTSILAQAAGSPDLAEAITSLLDQLDKTDDTTA